MSTSASRCSVGTEQRKEVSLAELAKHNGATSSWIALHGEVYDITDFVKIHPGGDVIRLGAGRDATCLFESYHCAQSEKKVQAALASKAIHVGHLEGATKGPDDKFFRVMRDRVEEYLRQNKMHYRSFEGLAFFEVVVTFLLYLTATYFVTVHQSVLAAVFLGLLVGRLGFLMHMGNHMATTKSVSRNAIAGYMMNVIGSSHIIWGFEHQVAHHMDPNEVGRDNDISIGDPLLRFNKSIAYRWWHQYQHVLTIAGMSIGFFKWYVSDMFAMWDGTIGNVKFYATRSEWLGMMAFKLVWLSMHVVTPVYLHGWRSLGLMVLFMVIGAQYLENVFIVNHVQDGLEPPSPMETHWAERQVRASADWSSASLFYNWLSGGLNHQVEHHLFPTMSSYVLPYVAPIVKKTCEDFNVPYRNYSHFGQAWLAMIGHLRALGSAAIHAQ